MAAGIAGASLIESNVIHRIVTAVACPELQIVKGGRGRNQRVAQLYMMALRESAKVFTGAIANRKVDGNTLDNRKQSGNRGMFQRARAMPDLSDSDRRAEQGQFAERELTPLRQDCQISSAGDLDQDVRIN